jgi:coenzyme F420-reducing hydrogenase alpha subunit
MIIYPNPAGARLGCLCGRGADAALSIYRIEEDGHIKQAPIVIACDTDEQAIERARQYVDGEAIEVWDLDRVVGRLDPHNCNRAETGRP